MNSQAPPPENLKSIINLFIHGKLLQALSETNQMLERFPNSVILYNLAGAVNAGLKNFDAAIESYEKALKIQPGYADAYYNMGIAYKNKGNLEAAIDCYNQALKIKPDYAEAYNNMANALKDNGNLEAAIDCYNQALKIKPDYSAAYNNMANALEDKGDLETAIDFYNEALKIEPDYDEAMSNLLSLLTSFTPLKENPNLIVKVNEKIRKIDIKNVTSKIISDDWVINLFSKSEAYMNSFSLGLKTKLSQVYRHSSVDLNCSRHKSIFNQHNIIPKFCFGCYKVQVEPRSIMELIKLFIVFDQLELNENNTRKCMVELRPEISGFYKGLIYCSDLKEATKVAEHLDKIIRQSIGPGLTSRIKRGCSEYPIAFPDYKEINHSGIQLMNYNEDWEVIEEAHDRKNNIENRQVIRMSLSGLNLKDVLIIQKWIDYAKGIGDPTADLLSHDTIHYKEIYERAKVRLDSFHFSLN